MRIPDRVRRWQVLDRRAAEAANVLREVFRLSWRVAQWMTFVYVVLAAVMACGGYWFAAGALVQAATWAFLYGHSQRRAEQILPEIPEP